VNSIGYILYLILYFAKDRSIVEMFRKLLKKAKSRAEATKRVAAVTIDFIPPVPPPSTQPPPGESLAEDARLIVLPSP